MRERQQKLLSEIPSSQQAYKYNKNLYTAAGVNFVFFRDTQGKRTKVLGGQDASPLYLADYSPPQCSQKVVVKKFKLHKDIYPELFITPHVNHPNILAGKVYQRGDIAYLVSPYFGVGSLQNLNEILRKPEFETIRYFILRQLLDALIYLSANNILHCDLHLGNILIDENAQIKIIDFGRANHIDEEKPIFNRFIYEKNEKLRNNWTDAATLAHSLLRPWQFYFPSNKILLQVYNALEDDEGDLLACSMKLHDLPTPNSSEIMLFKEALQKEQAHPRARL